MRLAAILVLLAGVAQAQAPACDGTIQRWAEAATRELGFGVQAVACPTSRVVLRLNVSGAPPLDVEMGSGPGAAFRRAGRWRLQPIVEVADFGTLPAAQRDGFARLIELVERRDPGVELEAVAPPRELLPLGAPALLAIALALALWLAARSPARREDLPLGLALAGGALALRLALGAWGPLHVNGQGPLWIFGAASDASALASYGPGYPELFGLVARCWPPDFALYSANALISAVTVGLAFAFARAAGLSRAPAMLAAAALALDPISIRMATTEAYFVPIIALTVGGSLAAVAAANRAEERARGDALACGLVAALLCAAAARIHPVAWPLVALVPVAALSGRDGSIGQRLLWTLVIAAEVSLLVAATGGRGLARIAGAFLSGQTLRPGVVVTTSSLALSALAGVAALLLARPRRLALPAVGWLALGALLSRNYAQSALWERSFDRLYLTLPLVACAAMVPRAWVERRWLAGALLVAGFALAAPRLLVGRTTQQREYAWLRGWFASLPADCRELHVSAAAQQTWFAPTYLARPRGRGGFVPADLRQPFEPRRVALEGCVYYVRSSLCATAQGRPACDEVERNFVLEPAVEASFPALADRDDSPYLTTTVQTRIFRVLATR